jgi:hypothetical protein
MARITFGIDRRFETIANPKEGTFGMSVSTKPLLTH